MDLQDLVDAVQGVGPMVVAVDIDGTSVAAAERLARMKERLGCALQVRVTGMPGFAIKVSREDGLGEILNAMRLLNVVASGASVPEGGPVVRPPFMADEVEGSMGKVTGEDVVAAAREFMAARDALRDFENEHPNNSGHRWDALFMAVEHAETHLRAQLAALGAGTNG